ncbi:MULTISPECIES: NAD(P)H-binding protein [unclassified Streptomyces]|uniref:NAD(P)H-binding protein n=1 Tax=unclassified Streptomyces TaxID=2593676 RepID=UPI001660981F|nr:MULTISPECIES: NAD(P)H-binding protein [unclassified Streptomyces]MBD0707890.1 NmrA family transcriptional regulator [Streptomyces sp. CBMA291]MBD0717591.1 NmrA family transcriptional regulator [Streptomyces sp. CBMA370]
MIVVTGATGNIGRPLVAALAEAGQEVVAVSRRPLPSGLPEGVRHAQADLGDFESIRPVLQGADAFFILLAGELNGPGEPAADLLAIAKEAGVKRVVLVSSQLAGTRSDTLSHNRLREFEAAVRDSGLEWTILRPGGFASNSFAWAEPVRTQRSVFHPFGDVALPVVDPADIADVAAVALTQGGHAGQTYVITGPEAITPRRQAEVIAEALGEGVTYVDLTREAAAEQMAQFMPPPVVEGTLDVLGSPLPVEQQVSPDVEKVLLRPARSYGDWVSRNLPAFR